jgi:O-antigen/teichoic acid export membrane protein
MRSQASTDGPRMREPGRPFWATAGWWQTAGRASIGIWVATALGFVGTVVAARKLGPGQYGTVVLAVSVATLAATFLDLTLEEAIVHHGSRALTEGDTEGLRGLLKVALFLDIGLGALVALGLAAAAGPISSLATGGRLDPVLLRLAAIGTLSLSADGTTGGILLLFGRPDLRAWMMAWASLVRLGLLVPAAMFGGPRTVLAAFAVASLVGSVTQGVISWRLARMRWSGQALGGSSWRWVRSLVPFGLHTSVATSILAARGALVSVILGRISGARAVGMFDVAMLPLSVVGVATAGVRMSLLPEQARLSARGEVTQLRRSIRSYGLAGIAVGLPGAIAGWFLLPSLVRALYSSEYDPAVLPARIMLVAAVVFLVTGWAKTFPAAIGRPDLRTKLAVFEFVIAAGFTAALAARGALGATIAMSATSFLTALLWWIMPSRVLKGPDRPENREGENG